jgi:hypothetical protein
VGAGRAWSCRDVQRPRTDLNLVGWISCHHCPGCPRERCETLTALTFDHGRGGHFADVRRTHAESFECWAVRQVFPWLVDNRWYLCVKSAVAPAERIAVMSARGSASTLAVAGYRPPTSKRHRETRSRPFDCDPAKGSMVFRWRTGPCGGIGTSSPLKGTRHAGPVSTTSRACGGQAKAQGSYGNGVRRADGQHHEGRVILSLSRRKRTPRLSTARLLTRHPQNK